MAAHWGYRIAWAGALALGSPFLLARTLLRPAEMRERRGLWAPLPDGAVGGIWLHAASVGEARSARALLSGLRERGLPVMLSVVTPAARALEAEFLAAGAGAVRHAPLDIGPYVRRAFRAVRPRALLLMETEIWPATLAQAARAQVPVAFLSARLTPRGARRLRHGRSLLRPLLAPVRVGAQSEEDAARWRSLGIADEQLRVTGNLKYESPRGRMSDAERAAARGPWRKIAVFGSVRGAEIDAICAAVHAAGSQTGPTLFVIAPRHPARTLGRLRKALAPARAADGPVGEVIERCRRDPDLLPRVHGVGAQGSVHVSSALPATVARHAPTILLLGTIGELQEYYRIADVIFVGGTLCPIGGHNLFEAAECGVPVLFGPHVENVADTAQALLSAGGGLSVRDGVSLGCRLRDWLAADREREEAGRNALEAARRLGGSLARTLAALEAWGFPLSPAPGSSGGGEFEVRR
ncbi:MAG: glycosyltransferase N-terminal domain-containing protein [Candidatus Eisenbacteria bacterium]